jgi:hypothetical protein
LSNKIVTNIGQLWALSGKLQKQPKIPQSNINH